MSIAWICIPSKRPIEHVRAWASKWRERGYGVALWRDPGEALPSGIADMQINDPYPGYAQAVNGLVRGVIEWVPECRWCLAGGDDVYPDPAHTAEEIARECDAHFYNTVELTYPPDRPEWSEIPLPSPGGSGENAPSYKRWSTFGVMQPTGDRYGEQPTLPPDHPMRGGYATRVCGSPWMGREFCLRINQGKGPLWPEYTHMFEDEELFHVAQKYGVLWQRPDLVQHHEHWARARQQASDMPEFLKPVNTPEHWAKYKQLFEQRKAAGFPGSNPL